MIKLKFQKVIESFQIFGSLSKNWKLRIQKKNLGKLNKNAYENIRSLIKKKYLEELYTDFIDLSFREYYITKVHKFFNSEIFNINKIAVYSTYINDYLLKIIKNIENFYLNLLSKDKDEIEAINTETIETYDMNTWWKYLIKYGINYWSNIKMIFASKEKWSKDAFDIQIKVITEKGYYVLGKIQKKESRRFEGFDLFIRKQYKKLKMLKYENDESILNIIKDMINGFLDWPPSEYDMKIKKFEFCILYDEGDDYY